MIFHQLCPPTVSPPAQRLCNSPTQWSLFHLSCNQWLPPLLSSTGVIDASTLAALGWLPSRGRLLFRVTSPFSIFWKRKKNRAETTFINVILVGKQFWNIRGWSIFECTNCTQLGNSIILTQKAKKEKKRKKVCSDKWKPVAAWTVGNYSKH